MKRKNEKSNLKSWTSQFFHDCFHNTFIEEPTEVAVQEIDEIGSKQDANCDKNLIDTKKNDQENDSQSNGGENDEENGNVVSTEKKNEENEDNPNSQSTSLCTDETEDNSDNIEISSSTDCKIPKNESNDKIEEISNIESSSPTDNCDNTENQSPLKDKEHQLPSPETEKRGYLKYSYFMVVIFSGFAFTSNVLWMFSVSVMFPKDIIFFVGEERKPLVLGIIMGVAAICTYATGPIVGRISDASTVRIFKLFGKKFEWGRRIPYILIGMLFFAFSMGCRTLFRYKHWSGLVIYSILGVLGACFGTTSDTCHSGLFGDLFHESQFDLVAGSRQFFNLLGAIFAVGILGFVWSISIYWGGFYYVLCFGVGFMSFGLAFLMLVFKEDGSNSQKKREEEKLKLIMEKNGIQTIEKRKFFQKVFDTIYDFIKPFKNWNFSVVFFSRLVYQLAFALIQSFMLYFLRDCVKTSEGFSLFGITGIITEEEQAQSVVGGTVLVVGLVSSVLGPVMSKYFRRKFLIFVSGTLMTIGSCSFIITKNFSVMVVTSVILGIGMGFYHSMYFALINLLLPDKKENAKDLAIYSIATLLPFSVAGPIGGALISMGEIVSKNSHLEHFGYVLMYGICIYCQVLGSGVILLVNEDNVNTKPLQSGKNGENGIKNNQ